MPAQWLADLGHHAQIKRFFLTLHRHDHRLSCLDFLQGNIESAECIACFIGRCQYTAVKSNDEITLFQASTFGRAVRGHTKNLDTNISGVAKNHTQDGPV